MITIASLADCGRSSVEFQVTLNTVELPKNWSLFNLNALLASSPGASSDSQPFTVGSSLLTCTFSMTKMVRSLRECPGMLKWAATEFSVLLFIMSQWCPLMQMWRGFEFLPHTASCIYEVDDIIGVSTIVPHMELAVISIALLKFEAQTYIH